MNTLQKKLVRQSFSYLMPVTTETGLCFYQKLFQLDPQLERLFSTDITLQTAKLMQMLNMAISSLDQLDQLLPIVNKLAKRHVRYGVLPHHYDTVGAALIATLDEMLAESFTHELREAWVALYTLLADTMIAAAYSEQGQVEAV